MVNKISEKEFDKVEASKLAVVDFSAAWCGPCQMLAPVLEEVSVEMDGKAEFYNVDVDENQSLAMKYGIMNIPALIILKNGEVAAQEIGFQPKQAVIQMIEKCL